MDEIIFEERAGVGLVTLNRPAALNAVTSGMVDALSDKLDEWEHAPGVERVVVRAVEGRAFSAGGDIRDLYDSKKAGRSTLEFFAREYRLNYRIATYPKPYVALVDGIVMGGGVGISFHGSHVIVGPNAKFAMPEVGIGFFPDVGATHFLSKLPGAIGKYLALTGARIGPGDTLWCGLATHGSANMAATEAAMLTAGPQSYPAHRFPPGTLAEQQATIADAFSARSLTKIVQRLTDLADENAFAAETLATLQTKSPTSLEIAHRQMERGRDLDLAECLKLEYRIVARILEGEEFYEGIRAAIIDKDNAPKWSPETLSAIDHAVVDAYLAPSNEELSL